MTRARRSRSGAALGAALLSALSALSGCGETLLDPGAVRSFDRPVDLAFVCAGRMRLVGDNGTADPDDPVEYSAQPIQSCITRGLGSIPNNAPPGQEDLPDDLLASSIRWSQIAVQPTSGTITVVTHPEKGTNSSTGQRIVLGEGDFAIDDGDPLTPGHNAIAVGSLPIAIATDTAGCHVVTANAGSCDLSVINADRLVTDDPGPLVRALPVMSGGEPLLARPAALVSVDRRSPIGVACPATPVGLYYVAYPDCHAVAAVDGATGQVVSSIRFDDAGNPSVVAGPLTCPRQCGEREPITAGARPSSLDLMRDVRVDQGVDLHRLAIGLDNRPAIAVVDLDADGLPLAGPIGVDLDGDVGVVDVAISQQIKMGGSRGQNDNDADPGVPAQFVYAVATDATVRVAEVLVANQECDTQVDPRFLYDERDPTRLVCFGVNEVGTPPRRALARGPGIQFLGQERPVAVAIAPFANAAAVNGEAAPGVLAGHFAFIALSNGFTAIANIDDDNYNDTYLPTEPLASQVALALPHQLRDAVEQRAVEAFDTMTNQRLCTAAPPNVNGVPIGGPRVDEVPTVLGIADEVTRAKSYVLPNTHATLCTANDAMVPVSDLGIAATIDVRERTFPDWRALPPDEQWHVSWEGALSVDDGANVIDGPAIRAGLVDIAGGGIRILDPSQTLCGSGVEPFDIVTLRGCDPARGDAQCGAGETCYLHPDARAATGACLPTAQLEALVAGCRDFLISQRRYSVFEASAGVLRLHERWRELRSTPLDGCTSDAQCTALAEFEASLGPVEAPEGTKATAFTYACEPNPTRAPGPDRCVMTCAADADCEAGTLCRAGHCLEGIVPAPACAAGLQRYDLRGSDALIVVGERTGFLHPIVEDAAGRCVKDPTASPLLRGRIPLSAPPCAGGDPADLTPNPCVEPVDHAERVPRYIENTCTVDNPSTQVQVRGTTAIRFNNPALRLTIVDPTYPGDAQCPQDRGGNLGRIPTVHQGYELRFRVSNGFSTFAAGARVVQPANVVRAPDGSVWVVDAGDIDDTSSGTPNLFGQLIRIDLSLPSSARVLQ